MKKIRNKNTGERILAQGVTVSNNTWETGLNNNDMLIGGTGSGKTGGYIFQNLLHPTGSILVSDTKGQLFKIFGEYLKSQGYKVEVLDFVRPKRSIAYNPLQYIERYEDGSFNEKDIKKIASILMPTLDSSEPFWERAATRYIAMLIGYVLDALPKEEQTLLSVADMHRECLSGQGRKLLAEWAVLHPQSFAGRKYNEMKGSYVAEKMWFSIMEFANEGLEPFTYKEFAPIFGHEKGIDFTRMGKKKTVVFVNSSDSDSSFHVLSNLLFAQALQSLMMEADENEGGTLDVPVRMIMDDFSASPKIQGFDNTISVIRSRNISVSLIIQSISQLSSKYSQAEATTILNNCDHIIFLSGHDQETADYVARYIDKTANTVLTMPRDHMVLITDGQKPRIVPKLTPYSVDVKSLLNKELARANDKTTQEDEGHEDA